MYQFAEARKQRIMAKMIMQYQFDAKAVAENSPLFLSSIENVIGSAFADIITGSLVSNNLDGQGGTISLSCWRAAPVPTYGRTLI